MPLLTPPQTPARAGLARAGAMRFAFIFDNRCAEWLLVAATVSVWTAVSPCRNTGA